MNQLEVTCPDAMSTMKVAKKIADQLEQGDLIELIGDVGSGKTTFVRGLAEGLGCKDEVSSPSFVLKNVYSGRLQLDHFDLYRLEDPGLIGHEIADSLAREDTAVVIEWAKTVSKSLPHGRIMIEFKIMDDEARKLKISYPEKIG